MLPETKRRNKARRKLLYAALDFLEAPHDGRTERCGSPVILYTQMQVAVLLRTLTTHYKMPKSIRRAEALGIAWNSAFTPKHEKTLLRKRLTKPVRYSRVSHDDDDDDDGELV